MKRIDSPGSGVIERWLVQEGEPVRPGGPLFILSRDQVAVTILSNSSHEWVLLKVVVPAGGSISVGTKLAIVGQAGETLANAQIEAISLYPPIQVRMSIGLAVRRRLLYPLVTAVLIEVVIVAALALYHLLRERTIPAFSGLLSQYSPFLIFSLVLYLIARMLVLPALHARRRC
jgi:pyruvate/2-oxoglutarate dehydrogenase complex dihydrolipoamide acyltransferase (E2) component